MFTPGYIKRRISFRALAVFPNSDAILHRFSPKSVHFFAHSYTHTRTIPIKRSQVNVWTRLNGGGVEETGRDFEPLLEVEFRIETVLGFPSTCHDDHNDSTNNYVGGIE